MAAAAAADADDVDVDILAFSLSAATTDAGVVMRFASGEDHCGVIWDERSDDRGEGFSGARSTLGNIFCEMTAAAVLAVDGEYEELERKDVWVISRSGD